MAGKPIKINIVADMSGDGIAKAQAQLDVLKAKVGPATDGIEKHGIAHKTMGDLAHGAGDKINEIASQFTSHLGPASGTAQKAIEGLTAKFESMPVSSVAAIGAAGLVAGAFLELGKKGVDAYTELGEKTKDFEEKAGTTAEQSSVLVTAFERLGIGADTGESAMARLAKTAGTTPDKLSAVGVEIGHTKDGAYDAWTTLSNVADAFAATDDQSQKAAIGNAAFGRSWATLAPVLNEGSKGLEDIKKKAKELGLVMSQDDVDAAFKYKMSLADLHETVQGLEVSLGRQIVPALTSTVDGMTLVTQKSAEASHGVLSLGNAYKLISMGGGATSFFEMGVIKGVQALGHHKESSDAAEKATAELGTTVEGVTTRSLSPFKDETNATKDEIKDYNTEVKNAKDYMKEYDQRIKDATDSQKALQKAQQDATGVQLSLDQATLSLDGSFQDLQDKTDDVNVAVRDHGAASKEARDAQHALDGQVLTTKQSIIDVGKAATDAAVNQAAANGVTLNAEQANLAQRDALQQVANKLDPSSSLAQWLNGYIAQLAAIPATKHTDVSVDFETNYHSTGTAPGQTGSVTVRASGGQALEDKPHLVGENGPELFVPDSNGTILPAGATRSMLQSPPSLTGGASKGGAMLHIENINISNGTPEDVRRELDWLIRTRL